MISYVAACILTIVAVEIFLRLPFKSLTRKLMMQLQKVQRVLGSRKISDHWKEKVLLAYSLRLAGCSLWFMILLSIIGVVVCLLSIIFDAILPLDVSVLETLTTWQGIALSLVVSVIFCLLRSYIVKVRFQSRVADASSSGIGIGSDNSNVV